MTDSFFGTEHVKVVHLQDWVQWASGKKIAARRVVLPMIQRGSVWPPYKLLDLWDTLLRGMPVGAMMAAESKPDDLVRALGEAGTHQSNAGDIDLIDGQQRTLAMLAGWPDGLKNPTRPISVWVDLIDTPQGEYRFRLWATTKSQPYGYARVTIGGQALGKLDRRDLRLANATWENVVDVRTLWSASDFMPWGAKFALPLTDLIAHKGGLQILLVARLSAYKQALEEKIQKLNALADQKDKERLAISDHFSGKLRLLPSEAELIRCVPALEAAVDSVLACQFPVIHVRRGSFEDQLPGHAEGVIDPPLAVLFKRVGSGGEPLSNADYVYSVIKYYDPRVHDTVEALLENESVSAIYTPTTLVMSAVRLTMLSMSGETTKIADSAKLDKADFALLVRNNPEFIQRFHADIQPKGIFASRLKAVLEKMSYSDPNFTNGLPKHALSLISIPLLEVILAWHLLKRPSEDAMEKSRLSMVRFALQGNLCILNYVKASEVTIKTLQAGDLVANSDVFPDQALMEVLSAQENGLAYLLPCPATLQSITGLTFSPDGTNGLRGWTRFHVDTTDERVRQNVEVYKRWWNRKGGYVHPMLLWLQREYVNKAFEKYPALAGMGEETPYDFDHILPSAQWSYWTGRRATAGNRFIDFPEKDDKGNVDNSGHWHIGNSIGNIHVLDSGENRSLGDASVQEKMTKEGFSKNAQITEASRELWLVASGRESDPRYWDKARALAFQNAVEQRAFALYTKFYDDLFPEATA